MITGTSCSRTLAKNGFSASLVRGVLTYCMCVFRKMYMRVCIKLNRSLLCLEVKFNMQIVNDCVFLWEFGKKSHLCILPHLAYLCTVDFNDYAL